MVHDVTLIPGDGIGPEVMTSARAVLEATGVRFAWHEQRAGAEVLEAEGTPLPDRVIEAIRATSVAFKGPVTTPVGTGFRSVNVALRKALDLYAAVRPARSYPGTGARFGHVDIVVVRENTEDVYAGVEFGYQDPRTDELIHWINTHGYANVREDVGVSIKLISRFGTERVVRYAFDYARQNGRRKVTAVHKANIMKSSDGLFLAIAREVAALYPDVLFDDMIVDNLCAQLVQHPEMFDVLVLPNLYGDIVSDLCAGLSGGLGIAPGANIGAEAAMFEPVHGSAPNIAGRDLANPTAAILSGVLMLRHLGEHTAANRVDEAVRNVLRDGDVRTADLPHGMETRVVGTREFTQAVIDEMERGGSG
ncbi:MAG TPA: isocitrate/isopropylmalate dehydrogenase family protein [Dehalococcoidia bacterium]|nr:isocitrate/isopropylmalate dehydrogenase family protein [Dehalococcoidia bacterium]